MSLWPQQHIENQTESDRVFAYGEVFLRLEQPNDPAVQLVSAPQQQGPKRHNQTFPNDPSNTKENA
jgi:hypothetical protein